MLRSRFLKAPIHRLCSLPQSAHASSWAQLNTALKRGAPLDIHPEVQDALATNKPVVALETALVTHGVPTPQNLELATALEDIVRSTGSIPATIGMVGGRVKIGMEKPHLEQLAYKWGSPTKISRRDIAAAISLKADGGTTCSATMLFAALAGIKVFATGGLGGVHRGAENSMDISADLGELARTPVGVVSSGVKSILDIRRTLEYLETHGVPVITYGVAREFPAFFSRHSGCDSPWNVDDPVTAAKLLHAQWQLGLENGALIAAPIPAEYEESGLAIQKAVDQAVAESEARGVDKLGKDVTPWLLSRVYELTGGKSLESNVALLKNTALIGGQIAVEYQRLLTNHESIPSASTTARTSGRPSPLASTIDTKPKRASPPPAQLMVVGSAAVDIISQPESDIPAMHTTTPGNVSMSLGGVARNIAEASHRVLASQYPSGSTTALLVAPIGADLFGDLIFQETEKIGMRVDGFIKSKARTAICNMMLETNGGLISGVADMGITAELDGNMILSFMKHHKPTILALDGNLSPATIKTLVRHSIENDIKVFFEPTSVLKSTTILPAIKASLDTVNTDYAPIAFASPNLFELAKLDQESSGETLNLTSHPSWWSVIDNLSLGSAFRSDLEQLARKNSSDLDPSKGTLAFLVDQGVAQMAIKLLPFFQHLVIKCGEHGVIVVMRIPKAGRPIPWMQKRSDLSQRRIVAHSDRATTVIQHFPALPINEIKNVTGAGDSFVGVLLAKLVQEREVFQDPTSLAEIILASQQGAILSLQSELAVSPALSTV